eukprot:TRINITY_DN8898_c0_g2_i1.p1 TRINITY_DN8898_c0_g2~~TRINITY_DN8898_c0_g2_i1.p1  ORF type:complete len:585 (-),score=146.67 TRINITY_DN8898_c0_g2_i1:428-2182(-)
MGEPSPSSASSLTTKKRAGEEIRIEGFSNEVKVDPSWSAFRRAIARTIASQAFEWSINIVILANFAVVIHQANLTAADAPVPLWLEVITYAMLVIYAVEQMLKLTAWRKQFFTFSNVVDLCIVLLDLCFLTLSLLLGELPSVSVLRVLRLTRIMRATRVLSSVPELAVMVKGIISTARAMCGALVLIAVALTLFSVAAVEFLHPVVAQIAADGGFAEGCERCERAFSSVLAANLTLFQTIIAGDSWGLIALPLLENSPASALILIPSLMFVNFGLLNLLLTAIVKCAQDAAEQDRENKMREKMRQYQKSQFDLVNMCKSMDASADGTLSFDELERGYDENHLFAATLNLMDIKRVDLPYVWSLMTDGGQNVLTYDEFAEELYQMKFQDDHTLLVFLKAHVAELREKMLVLNNTTQDSIRRLSETVCPRQSSGLDGQGKLQQAIDGEQKQCPPAMLQERKADPLRSVQDRLDAQIAPLLEGLAARVDEQAVALTRNSGMLSAVLQSLQPSAIEVAGSSSQRWRLAQDARWCELTRCASSADELAIKSRTSSPPLFGTSAGGLAAELPSGAQVAGTFLAPSRHSVG